MQFSILLALNRTDRVITTISYNRVLFKIAILLEFFLEKNKLVNCEFHMHSIQYNNKQM